MTYYVYKIINNINNKFYIGKRKHNNPKIDLYMGSGKLIKLAIEKYGKSNFSKEIIEIFKTNDEAAKLEFELVTKEVIKNPNCYNLHEGGYGGFHHINDGSPEHIKRCKKASKLVKNRFNLEKYRWTSETGKEASKKANKKKKEMIKNGENKHWKSKKNIQTKSTLGHKWYRNIKTGDRQLFINKEIPDDWVTSDEYRNIQRNKMKKLTTFGKHWYNDRVKSYLRFEKDAKELLRGRI